MFRQLDSTGLFASGDGRTNGSGFGARVSTAVAAGFFMGGFVGLAVFGWGRGTSKF